jgi:hypothetical protein
MAGTPVTGGGLYLGRQFVTINGIEFAVSFDAKIIKLAAFRKAVLTPVRPEGVFTFLDCSSVHLTKATLMMLSNGDHLRYPSTVAPYAYGVLVGVPNYEEPDEPMDGFPPDVLPILTYAASIGCSMVRFDRDGIVYPEFTQYEHDLVHISEYKKQVEFKDVALAGLFFEPGIGILRKVCANQAEIVVSTSDLGSFGLMLSFEPGESVFVAGSAAAVSP